MGVHRPRIDGKFLFVGSEKLYVRGVTYGTFRARWPGDDGYDPIMAERDFAAMAAHGINAIRLYSVPPRWLLDTAQRNGLWVMVGLPWEQHVAFLDLPGTANSITQRVRAAVRACAGHPAILAFAIGNEIPARIVRWQGIRRVERFLERLASVVRREDPGALVTYANYPSTEYLRCRSADFLAFNVYLEGAHKYDEYLARLQNLAGDRPIVISELGLDSHRGGEEAQAQMVDRQVRSTFARGAAGCFVFAWTDEWARGDIAVEDWDFGLTTRDRRPKPALQALADALRDVPFPQSLAWPRISVVLCSFNGERVIRDCLDGLMELDYPDHEIIVVDDGSTDRTATIVGDYPFRVIRTPNQGLSAARNEGLAAATGEIVAYIDDDARPDRQWLRYLAWTFLSTDHVAVGGPNIAPEDSRGIADIVAEAPGGPIHILRSDEEAEHIPGCNAAFRVDALRAISGFDPTFRIAGDDVDVCWRLHERGWSIGFSPGALVWHQPRSSARAYLRQQRGYGRAEALLERKWPSRYNRLGHVTWPGQLYGPGVHSSLLAPERFYQGTWGSAAYQSVYSPSAGRASTPLMPEWYLLIAAMLALGVAGIAWPPLLFALAIATVAAGLSVYVALVSTVGAVRDGARRAWLPSLRWGGMLALLIALQPIARLWGRVSTGLTPWRRRGERVLAMPLRTERSYWTEDWQSMEARLRQVEETLQGRRAAVKRGGPFDAWDLEVRSGAFAWARSLATCEEHGGGRQLVRFRVWPRFSAVTALIAALFGVLAVWAALDGHWLATLTLATLGLAVVVRACLDAAAAVGSLLRAMKP